MLHHDHGVVVVVVVDSKLRTDNDEASKVAVVSNGDKDDDEDAIGGRNSSRMARSSASTSTTQTSVSASSIIMTVPHDNLLEQEQQQQASKSEDVQPPAQLPLLTRGVSGIEISIRDGDGVERRSDCGTGSEGEVLDDLSSEDACFRVSFNTNASIDVTNKKPYSRAVDGDFDSCDDDDDDDDINSDSVSFDDNTEMVLSRLDPPVSRGEQWRDHALRCLDLPIMQKLGIVVLILVIADGALFFFLLMGWHRLCRPRRDCDPRNELYNLSIHILNVLLSYTAILSLPWRLANFFHLTHLSCFYPIRSSQPGRNLYGLPDPELWFHIPSAKRLGITIVLLLNCTFQFINHGTRIYFYNFDRQGHYPGNIWTSVFFAAAFACAGVGGTWMAIEAARMRKRHPGKFGPGPIGTLHELWNDKKEMLGKRLFCSQKRRRQHIDTEISVAAATDKDDPTEHGCCIPTACNKATTATLENGLAHACSFSVDSEQPYPPPQHHHHQPHHHHHHHYIDPTREKQRRTVLKEDRAALRMWAM